MILQTTAGIRIYRLDPGILADAAGLTCLAVLKGVATYWSTKLFVHRLRFTDRLTD
jgi:hypothetical protein